MPEDQTTTGPCFGKDASAATAARLAAAAPLKPSSLAHKVLYRSLPSFFIVGPPRTGTSWLHEVLSGHVILPEPTKETRFFDHHFDRGLDWYLRHFPRLVNGGRMGEIAPTYFASAQARTRIRHTIGEPRIVCIFRHPVHRVFSLYRLKRAYGLIQWSLEQAIHRDPELLASGMYATHLKAWQAVFGADRVLAAIYEDLRDQPQCFLDDLLDFLRVPRLTLTPSQVHHVHGSDTMTQPRSYYWTRSSMALADWLKARRFDGVVAAVKRSPLCRLVLGGGNTFGEISLEAASKICEFFRPEIEELEAILQRDFSAWKSIGR